jgi:hypothetical protein
MGEKKPIQNPKGNTGARRRRIYRRDGKEPQLARDEEAGFRSSIRSTFWAH